MILPHNFIDTDIAKDLALDEEAIFGEAEGLIDFLKKSPSSFHAIAAIKNDLIAAGFSELQENKSWDVIPSGKYFVMRNGSSICAFEVGKAVLANNYSYQISAAHSDSPTFKLKHHLSTTDANYTKFQVEAYGGMIDATWFDRPLGIAGRVIVREADGSLKAKLFYPDADLCLIPNVAIHLKRDINQSNAINRACDTYPLLSAGLLEDGDFYTYIAMQLGCAADDIVAHDLYLVNRVEPRLWGHNREFISAARLDDLECAYVSLQGFLKSAANDQVIKVYCIFDNEEVGSGTKQGALSTFLKDTLERINFALGASVEDSRVAYAKSFMVSADNGHALHLNHPELSDADHAPKLNQGPVIKEAANQHYTTDAMSRAVFSEILGRAHIASQSFANRSDMAGGSTLGNLSNQQISLNTVDMGLAQLAMHSAYETAGTLDVVLAARAFETYFGTKIDLNESGFSLN